MITSGGHVCDGTTGKFFELNNEEGNKKGKILLVLVLVAFGGRGIF